MTGEWLTTLLLTLPLVGFAVFDTRLARTLARTAAIRPQSTFLGLFALVVKGIAVGVWCAVALGVASVAFLTTGVRLLPPPLGLVLIYAAVIVASVVLLPVRRQLSRWEHEIPPDPNHRYGTDE